MFSVFKTSEPIINEIFVHFQNYRVMISGGGQEMTSSDKPVTETTASFTGLKASTSYTIEVTGQPVDGTKVEVVTAVLSCMTKGRAPLFQPVGSNIVRYDGVHPISINPACACLVELLSKP